MCKTCAAVLSNSFVAGPDPTSTPRDVAAWWRDLTPEQQAWIVANRPDAVRNCDGVPTAVRDGANRAWLDAEQLRRQAELDRRKPRRFLRCAPRFLHSRDRLRAKLIDLARMREALARVDDTYLIGLDTSARRTRAIVSVGNPDTADHVAVSIPGMGAQVNFGLTAWGIVHEANLLCREATIQLERAGHGTQTVAGVGWIWYDTPPWQGPAIFRRRAIRAAPVLTRYLRSLAVTSTVPHITVIGHSYGSLVSGLALAGGAYAVVDDYVVCGSAGFYARDVADVGLPAGHVFVMQAPDDPIRIPAHLGLFGGDPTAGAFVQLSTAATTTPDGVRRDGAFGHAEYPRSFTAEGKDMLRTTGYNAAVVVAGLPALAVPDAAGRRGLTADDWLRLVRWTAR